MGVEFVLGLQGDDLRQGVVATAKHLVGYGASEGGMNWAPVRIGACELHDVYLHPFEAAVKTAGLRSVMHAYNEIDGMPCAADRALLTGLLRERWGFTGTVVSDYFAVRQIETYHRLARDAAHAAARRSRPESMSSSGTDCYGAPLLEAIRGGLTREETLDGAVRRVLATKFELGLFEQPFVDVAEVPTRRRDAQRALAQTIARKSLVLLKNDGTLPLSAGHTTDRGDRPERRCAAPPLRRLLLPGARRVAARDARRPRERFSIATPDRLEFGTTMPEAPTIVDALRARFGDASASRAAVT